MTSNNKFQVYYFVPDDYSPDCSLILYGEFSDYSTAIRVAEELAKTHYEVQVEEDGVDEPVYVVRDNELLVHEEGRGRGDDELYDDPHFCSVLQQVRLFCNGGDEYILDCVSLYPLVMNGGDIVDVFSGMMAKE